MEFIIIFLCFIAGAAIAGFLVYYKLKPRLEQVQTINEEIRLANEENYRIGQQLREEVIDLNSRKAETIKSLQDLETQAQTSGEIFLKNNLEIAQTHLEKATEELSNKYQEFEKNCQEEYVNMATDLALTFQKDIDNYKTQIDELNKILKEKQSIVEAAVAANKRAVEIEQKQEFYTINLSKQDKEEIKKLKEVLPYIRDKEALNKVIWKIYYEKPTNDLIGRVVGSTITSGIYKITNIQNNMCYIGQSVNIADRWKQHIKRGLGAETPTRNKLYPAMEEFNVENFTFEIIEKCPKISLDKQEDYWQDYFKAKEFGYSIK